MDGDLLESAIVENAAVVVDRVRELGVGRDATVDHAGVGDAELELVGLQLHGQTGLEKLDLAGVEVAYAEISDAATIVKFIEGFGDFLGFDQGVRSVEEEDVEIIGGESLEDSVDGVEDVGLREVEETGANAAFAL